MYQHLAMDFIQILVIHDNNIFVDLTMFYGIDGILGEYFPYPDWM